MTRPTHLFLPPVLVVVRGDRQRTRTERLIDFRSLTTTAAAGARAVTDTLNNNDVSPLTVDILPDTARCLADTGDLVSTPSI